MKKLQIEFLSRLSSSEHRSGQVAWSSCTMPKVLAGQVPLASGAAVAEEEAIAMANAAENMLLGPAGESNSAP